uniref:Uncharacterized protein n=1 Tax=Panthera leo TaxID=9689 RepID=A0A8C8XJX1_PANLE
MKRELAGSQPPAGSALCTNRGGVRVSPSFAAAALPGCLPAPPASRLPSYSLPQSSPLSSLSSPSLSLSLSPSLLSLSVSLSLRWLLLLEEKRDTQLQPHPGTCHHL